MIVRFQLPTSAEMRAAIKARLDAGLPLGASHNGPPVPEGLIVYGSLIGPDDYAKGPLTASKDQD